MDDPDAGRQPVHLGEDVARHEDGHSVLRRERAQQLADLDHAGRVETIGGLVKDEQGGLVEQRTGEGEALQVPQRERAGPPVRVGPEGEALDHPPDHAPVRHPLQTAGDLQVLAHGEVGIGGGGLDQVTDPAPRPARPRPYPLAKELGVPGGGRDHAEQHADSG